MNSWKGVLALVFVSFRVIPSILELTIMRSKYVYIARIQENHSTKSIYMYFEIFDQSLSKRDVGGEGEDNSEFSFMS